MDQEETAGGEERGLWGTTAGSEERAASRIHTPGEIAPAQIQNQDLSEKSRSFLKECPLALRRLSLRYPMPSPTVM
jgi:hypothetical protein